MTIHLRAVPGAMSDLKTYLSNIQEVSDYILIEASDAITSLEFLSSLRVIRGKNLKDGRYSLYINRNYYLQSLFNPNVTKHLKIENGSALFEYNPILCMNYIDEIRDRFPITPQDLDIPIGSNGYRGGCKEVRFNFTIKATSDTSVKITFPIEDHDIYYSALYVRLPHGIKSTVVPESCSESEWHDADVPKISGNNYSVVELKSLLPASTYALCIEVYDPEKKILSRSNIFNFTTPVGIPEPPFILELVASSSDVVVVRWVDHKNYVPHIKYYELDVALIEINSRNSAIDYCKHDIYIETDDIRHALVRRPPPEYNRGCESMCGILASVTPGAMAEDYFDVCQDRHLSCNSNHESVISNNSTVEKYVRTLVLNISGPRNDFQVGGLAPFSDYKFRLRACVAGQCSRSARGNVRTLRSKNADNPTVTFVEADKLGLVVVKWEPPKVSNGPIFTYTVEVLPRVNVNDLMPQTWCASAQDSEIVVRSVIAAQYLVRVCVKTLASSKVCSEWEKVEVPVPEPAPQLLPTSKIVLMWTGFIFGSIIYFISLAVGWYKRRSGVRSEVVPLVDNTVLQPVESEAPALMISDFMPFRTIHLD